LCKGVLKKDLAILTALLFHLFYKHGAKVRKVFQLCNYRTALQMSSQKKPVLVMSELGNKRSEKKANFPAFLSEWAKLG
jgi:hypothetical protein